MGRPLGREVYLPVSLFHNHYDRDELIDWRRTHVSVRKTRQKGVPYPTATDMVPLGFDPPEETRNVTLSANERLHKRIVQFSRFQEALRQAIPFDMAVMVAPDFSEPELRKLTKLHVTARHCTKVRRTPVPDLEVPQDG